MFTIIKRNLNINKMSGLVDKFGRTNTGNDNQRVERIVTGGLNLTQAGSIFLKRDGSNTVTGDIDMNSHKLTNVEDPDNEQDSATKKYVDNLIGHCLSLNGGTMLSLINMGLHKIVNVAEPRSDSDVTTKKYVDDEIENARAHTIIKSDGNKKYTDDMVNPLTTHVNNAVTSLSYAAVFLKSSVSIPIGIDNTVMRLYLDPNFTLNPTNNSLVNLVKENSDDDFFNKIKIFRSGFFNLSMAITVENTSTNPVMFNITLTDPDNVTYVTNSTIIRAKRAGVNGTQTISINVTFYIAHISSDGYKLLHFKVNAPNNDSLSITKYEGIFKTEAVRDVSGNIHGEPTLPQHAATKRYVDNSKITTVSSDESLTGRVINGKSEYIKYVSGNYSGDQVTYAEGVELLTGYCILVKRPLINQWHDLASMINQTAGNHVSIVYQAANAVYTWIPTLPEYYRTTNYKGWVSYTKI